MENAPLHPDADDSHKKPGAKKKKKNAEALGVFALDPSPADKPAERSENIWEKLALTKRKGGETVEETALSQIFEDAEVQRLPEANDAVAIEATPDTLSEPEERFVERTIVEARQQAGSMPLAEEESETPKAAAAAIELFRHKVVSGGEPAKQAFAETLHALSAEAPAPEQPQESPVTDSAHVAPGILSEPDQVLHRPEIPEAERISQLNPERIPSGPAGRKASEEAGAFAQDQLETSSGAHGIGAPPRPPHVPHMAANYFPPTPGIPTLQSAKTEKELVSYYNNGDVVGAALLGGLVGYLIGRRRGRIKTERKLKPIQKKLERRVAAVERDIAFKEAHIRKMARRQSREQQRSQYVEQSTRRDQQRPEAPEANQLHGKKVSPERIGRVVVTAGDKLRKRTETAKPEKIEKSQPPKPVDKRIETMNRAELLDLSNKVPIENTTLRQVYETHLVGEQGLRRLMSEYTRGGDVQKALRAELVEHEMDFERDPLLRDRKRPAEPSTDHSQPTLETLLQKAGVLDHTEVREELATLKVRQARQEQQHHQQQRRRCVLDVSMVTVIAVLTALVIVLLLRGR